MERSEGSTSAGAVKLTPVSERHAPVVSLLRDDCKQEVIPLEGLLYTEALSEKVVTKLWGIHQGNLGRGVQDAGGLNDSSGGRLQTREKCPLILFALSFQIRNTGTSDSLRIQHSNVAAARALRGADAEIIDY